MAEAVPSNLALPRPFLEVSEVPVSCARRIAIIFSWCIFAVLLMYASGFPLLVISILNQYGGLPTSKWVLVVLFPLGYEKFQPDNIGTVDVINQNYLGLAVPFFMLAMGFEALMAFIVLPHDWCPKQLYRFNDTVSSLSLGILNQLVLQVVIIQWSKPLYKAIYTHLRLTDAFADKNSVVGWWLCWLLTDALYYVFHRASHYYSWLWAAHVTHHSSEEYNLSTALRQTINDVLVPSVLISSTGLAFLFPHELTILHAQFSLLYQYWIHTQLVPPLPTIELVFNTPSLHRIHHVRNEQFLGKNYGSFLSIWDRMGGTFEGEDGSELYYGIIPPLNSWNPVWANVHHWHHMIFVQRKWHSWRTPFVHWTPPNGRCPKLGSRLNPYQKYDVFPPRGPLRTYTVIEAVLIGFLAVAPIVVPPSSEWISNGTGWSHMVAGSVQMGAVLVLVTLALCSVASLESATTGRQAMYALTSNACFHVMLTVIAAFVINACGISSPLAYVALAAYGALRVLCILAVMMGTNRQFKSLLAASDDAGSIPESKGGVLSN